jgi:hypothetical protein
MERYYRIQSAYPPLRNLGKGTFSKTIELLSCTSIIQKTCLMLEGKSVKDIIPPEAYGKPNPFKTL